jgi:acyl-CoA synthetase (AMP-forming)/AMP-acid ligase II
VTGLADRIAAVLALDPAAPAVEFGGRWHTWGDLAATADEVADLVGPGTEVGILLRNRPRHVGLLLGVLRAGGCVVTIDPGRRDSAALDLPVVVGDPTDLADFGRLPPTTNLPPKVEQDPLPFRGQVRDGEGVRGQVRSGVAVRMLTSGTTGPAKRVDLSYRMLERVLVGAKHYESGQRAGLRLRRGVAVVNAPLVHLSGIFRVLQCVSDGRSFALLERFTVDGWVDAVRRHRPATASLVPAALRMVLEARVDPDDLASLRSVVSGTAPLDPDDADAFTERFGVPVLVSYAATEFGGGVAGWNLADHQRFWAAKRGSVGRAHPGCELRVVDGLLEVQAAQLGEGTGWVRTTDRARIDDDGFVWILGRADQAIIRGGFKVHPDDVRAVLERHPAVRGAAVVGRDDRRLGAVPVAAVELRPGADPPTPDDLRAHAAATLSRYEVPTEVRVVAELPRTASGKVDLGAVRDLVGRQEA